MIVPRPVSDVVRGVGRNALDLPVAAFAAVAVAFLAFAMPSDLLTDLVGSSGLPSLLPAAEPPLGFKARIGIGVAGAVLVFGLVFVLLRVLDRTGLEARDREEALPQGPRARRRDFHPDAPAPRPISAARDFGEPAPPIAPKPLWLEPAEVEPQPLAFQPEPEPEGFDPEPIAPEPQPFEFRQEPEPVADQVEPGPFELHPEPAPVAGDPEPSEFPREPDPCHVEPEPVDFATDPEPAPAPAIDGSASIAELMARLERGLARARTGQDMAAPAFPPAEPAPRPAAETPPLEPPPLAEAPPPQVFPEANDDRLQSAIDSLQRLTSRQS
jgi:hypothetical protein